MITKYSQVFQPDLPGYNNSFGLVFADFQFTSSARPPSQKVFTPAYGPHNQLLLHQKFLSLKNKGVLKGHTLKEKLHIKKENYGRKGHKL